MLQGEGCAFSPFEYLILKNPRKVTEFHMQIEASWEQNTNQIDKTKECWFGDDLNSSYNQQGCKVSEITRATPVKHQGVFESCANQRMNCYLVKKNATWCKYSQTGLCLCTQGAIPNFGICLVSLK